MSVEDYCPYYVDHDTPQEGNYREIPPDKIPFTGACINYDSDTGVGPCDHPTNKNACARRRLGDGCKNGGFIDRDRVVSEMELTRDLTSSGGKIPVFSALLSRLKK